MHFYKSPIIKLRIANKCDASHILRNTFLRSKHIRKNLSNFCDLNHKNYLVIGTIHEAAWVGKN